MFTSAYWCVCVCVCVCVCHPSFISMSSVLHIIILFTFLTFTTVHMVPKLYGVTDEALFIHCSAKTLLNIRHVLSVISTDVL